MSFLTVEMLIALPGTGKSTYAAKRATDDSNVRIVCKDTIREMLYGDYKFRQEDELLIQQVAHTRLLTCLENAHHVIVDETHITVRKRTELIRFIRSTFSSDFVKIIYRYFPYDPECVKRRCAEPRGVDPERWRTIIADMLRSFEAPTIAEGCDGIIVFNNRKVENKLHPVVEAQRKYCWENNLIYFMVEDCPRCRMSLLSMDGIVAAAASTHITKCPHCNHSFCD